MKLTIFTSHWTLDTCDENSLQKSNQSWRKSDLWLHLSSLLGIHSQDVLVVADGVLTVLVLSADVPSESLQDAVGLKETGKIQMTRCLVANIASYICLWTPCGLICFMYVTWRSNFCRIKSYFGFQVYSHEYMYECMFECIVKKILVNLILHKPQNDERVWLNAVPRTRHEHTWCY